VLSASAAGFLALALASTPTDVSATTSADECEAVSARIELSSTPPGKPPVVCIGAGLPVHFHFDSMLQQDSLQLQEPGWFEDVATGRQTLALTPLDTLTIGKRSELKVCFADGAAPACATFELIVHPGLGMQQVKVFREPRTVTYFQQVAKDTEANLLQCRAEVQQLRAGRVEPDGLRGAIASGLVDANRGVALKDLSRQVGAKEGNALIYRTVTSYRAKERVAVEVSLLNPGTVPWTAAGAVIRGPKGEVLKALPLWPSEPILPAAPGLKGEWGRIVVEVMATEVQGPYTLVLWDAERQRTVTLGNVTFPQ
jgi:uncharacterized protein (TIGR02268 family)